MILNQKVIHTGIQNVINLKPHNRVELMQQILYEQTVSRAYCDALFTRNFISVALLNNNNYNNK